MVFKHFKNTCFIAEADDKIIGFLLGFLSQTHSEEAHIKLIMVHPEYRWLKVGKLLYQRFFEASKNYGRNKIIAVTSPNSTGSIMFRKRMRFGIKDFDDKINGIPV